MIINPPPKKLTIREWLVGCVLANPSITDGSDDEISAARRALSIADAAIALLEASPSGSFDASETIKSPPRVITAEYPAFVNDQFPEEEAPTAPEHPAGRASMRRNSAPVIVVDDAIDSVKSSRYYITDIKPEKL